jgi:hypothetical protein
MSVTRYTRAAGCLAVLALSGAARAAPDLTTTAERSKYLRTGRYDEVQSLCRAFQSAYSSQVRCFTFGQSPEGRPLLALAASADGVLEPRAARAKNRPVVLFMGGIHAGEIDGKDAGFWALRELLAERPEILRRVTALFVPVFNVDGHERFGPHHRPNQRGPEEAGFRTTAQNLNLNRDFTKAEAPEMAALLALLKAWDPTVFTDLHVTDGAKFEHDVALVVSPDGPPAGPRSGRLGEAARAMRDELLAGLVRRAHLPLPFYPSFRSSDDPTSGFEATPPSPRYSNAYLGVRNRLAILVETHSWRTYAERVQTTRDVLAELFELAAVRAADWRTLERAADDEGAHLGGTVVPLAYGVTGPPRTIDFRGYAYTRQPSDISGAPWIRYDEHKPQLWRVPFYDRITTSVAVRAPLAGYLVPPAYADWLAHKLDLHGLRYQRLTTPRDLPAEAFRASTVAFASAPFEGRFTARVQGDWHPERHQVAAGALFIPIDQPEAQLLMHLLEPTGPDSLVSWGFFHAAFEEKEYMEAYLLEEEARKMLDADPGLRAELAHKLKTDPTFAASPRQRLAFFFRRHPAWDDRVNLYPVLRLDARP